MEKARQNYEGTYDKNFDMLNTLTGLDNTGYNRFSDDRSYSDNQMDKYTDATGHVPMDTSSIPQDSPLRQIQDYAAEIQKREAVNPNDPTIPMLKALRYEKVMNDPEMYKQYGSSVEVPMGYKTAQTRGAEATAEANAEQTTWDRALATWKASGTASPSVSKILGVPSGQVWDNGGSGSGSGGGSNGGDAPKETVLTKTQILDRAKYMLEEKVDTGRLDDKGNKIKRPKYTMEQFDEWLSGMLPDTEEGEILFDDIIAKLGPDAEYWDLKNPEQVSKEAMRRKNRGILEN